MEFRQLESFCAVVRYQSFTKAAEKLYISQPTISTHIRMLEQEFNSRLIIRFALLKILKSHHMEKNYLHVLKKSSH